MRLCFAHEGMFCLFVSFVKVKKRRNPLHHGNLNLFYYLALPPSRCISKGVYMCIVFTAHLFSISKATV